MSSVMSLVTDSLPMVAPADNVAGPPQGHWTYPDYAALPDDGKRYEVIEGVLYMAPSASEPHQASNTRFIYYLFQQIEFAGLGRVYSPPFDVELLPKFIVQPDAIVVLNEHLDRITPNRIVGAPDLVVEIASPGTAGYDRRKKQDAYALAGVPEYWIAEPASRTVEVLILEEGQYRSLGVFTGQATLPSSIIKDFAVKVEQFFR